MVVAKQVADRGRAVEVALYAKWGAPATTLMLMPPADGPMGELLMQRRTRLERVSGVNLPTGRALSDSAAESYRAAARWLIENTRDRARFPVVWSELKNYGFERNSLGIRLVGVLTSALGTAILLASAAAGASGADLAIVTNAVLAGVCAIVGLWWWRVPSESRVRTAADRYAERLLDASAQLPSSRP